MNKIEFIRRINELLNDADMGVEIKYGYSGDGSRFTEVDRTLDIDDSFRRECVLVKYIGQSDQFGLVQSIEADGKYWILKDILKAVDRL